MGSTFKCDKFMFNNISSDRFNLMICSFDTNTGIITSSEVGNVTIETSKNSSSYKWNRVKSDYESPLISTFSICKKDGSIFTALERRMLGGIFQSKNSGYKPLQFFGEEYRDVVFYAKCTKMDRVICSGNVIGYNLTFETNAPYGFSKEQKINISMSTSTLNFTISNSSDEFDSILFPKLKITIKENCDFSITNNRLERTFSIDDCTTGEIIDVDPNIGYIYSSVREESIIDDFNCVWFGTVGNVFDMNNSITVTGMADIEISCVYPRKVGA